MKEGVEEDAGMRNRLRRIQDGAMHTESVERWVHDHTFGQDSPGNPAWRI